jgi:hypothetical protein
VAYKITDNLFNSARAESQIGQAQSYETSSALQLLNSLQGATSTAQSISADEFEKEMKLREQTAIETAVNQAEDDNRKRQLEADTAQQELQEGVESRGAQARAEQTQAATMNFVERTGTTAYDIAYNKANRANVTANIATYARTEIAKLAQQYATDPDGFKGATVGLFEKIVEQYNLNPETQRIVFDEVMNENNRYLPNISVNGYKVMKDNQFAAQTKEAESLQNSALNTVRSGNMSKYRDDRANYIARLDIMRNEGFINSSQYNDAIVKMDKEASTQMLQGSVERALVVNNITGAIKERNSWEKDLRSSGLMSPDEIDSALSRVDSDIAARIKAIKEQATSAAFIADVWDNDGLLDYKDTTQKKAVNAFADQMLGANPDYSDPVNRQKAAIIANRTGVVPASTVSYIRKTQFSNDPQVVLEGVTTMQNLLATNPAFKDQFSSSDIKFADSVDGFISMGMEPQQAVDNAKAAQTTEFKDLQAANLIRIGDKADYTKRVNNGVSDFIGNQLDRWFEFGETITEEQRAKLTGDYDRLFKFHLGTTGNVEGAQKAVERDLRGKYGITYVNGVRELTAYPVEQTTLGVPSEQISEDNPVTKQWSQDKLTIAKDLGLVTQTRTGSEREGTLQIVEEPDASSLSIQPTELVQQGIPLYQVYRKDENGIYSPVYDTDAEGNNVFKYWRYSSEQQQITREAEQAETVEQAQERHKKSIERTDAINRQIQQSTQSTGSNMWGAMNQRRF